MCWKQNKSQQFKESQVWKILSKDGQFYDKIALTTQTGTGSMENQLTYLSHDLYLPTSRTVNFIGLGLWSLLKVGQLTKNREVMYAPKSRAPLWEQ